MGKVRTQQIKKLAKELVSRFPDKFTQDYRDNKQVVNKLVEGATPKIRNRVAGYVTHLMVAKQITSSNDVAEEEA